MVHVNLILEASKSIAELEEAVASRLEGAHILRAKIEGTLLGVTIRLACSHAGPKDARHCRMHPQTECAY